MTYVETRAQQERIARGEREPGGETEGTEEGRERVVHGHSGHSPQTHPNSPAGVTHVEKSIQAGEPSTVRDQPSDQNGKQTEPW